MAKKVCIDSGHYGKYNRCPGNSKYYESEVMWKLHLLQKKYLEQYGIEVITTRNNQATDLDLYTRGAKSKGCDLFISDHSNAVGSGMNESVDYPVAYGTVNGKADKIGEQLAKCIQTTMGTKQNGRLNHRKNNSGTDYYGVLRGAAAVGTPGLILEHSFHTNSRAVEWLLNDTNLDKLAKAEAEVIAKYLGISTKPSTVKQSNELYGLTAEEVVKKIGPLMTADEAKTGVLACVSAAQFILESGYGQSELAQNANNFFGMKTKLSGNTWAGSVWDGNSIYTKQTQEYINGKYETVTADFRKYTTIAQSIEDHSAYLLGAKHNNNLRYKGLKGEKDYKKAFTIIKEGGYATSPDYVEKLCAVVEKWNLTQYNATETTKPVSNKQQSYMIMVDKVEKGDVLNIRKEPNVNAAKTGSLKYNDPYIYTIVEERNGWGKLKSGLGWINLHYTKKVSGTPKPTKTLDDWANEVRNGKHGNGKANRTASLKKAGCPYDYQTVQNRVNQLCK